MHEFKDETKFKKIFIHELGHFIADSIVFENYNMQEPSDLSIDWIEYENKYQGSVRTKTDNSKRMFKAIYPNTDFRLYELESIITLLYGCIFQELYNESDLMTDCLNSLDGQRDNLYYEFAIQKYNLDKDEIDEKVKRHVEILKKSNAREGIQNFDFSIFNDHSSSIAYFLQSKDLNGNKDFLKIKNIISPLLIEVYEELKKQTAQ